MSLPAYATFTAYPNIRAGHVLSSNGQCSCGKWSLEGATEPSLVRSHQLHVEMTRLPQPPTTKEDPHVSTLPDMYMPLRDHFVKQAMRHPAFRFMTPVEVVQSVENRLWSIVQLRRNDSRPLEVKHGVNP